MTTFKPYFLNLMLILSFDFIKLLKNLTEAKLGVYGTPIIAAMFLFMSNILIETVLWYEAPLKRINLFAPYSEIEIAKIIQLLITGNEEKVYIDFPYTNRLLSIYSQRQTNPDTSLKGELNKAQANTSSGSIGQLTLYIYLFSVFITVISSFGGNSMELMWIFTNTLQLIYYLSVVNVNFPDIVNIFFPYIQICNANNQYVSELSYMIIPSSKFESGNTVFGETAFYVNCSDKIPWLIPVVILFCFVKSTDYCNPKEDKKCFRWFLKLVGKLKYDFFLRLSIELELDIAFNAILNIYFYNFSSVYEVISFILAVCFMLFLCASVIFSAYFILTKRRVLEEKPESLESFSCLFCEIKFRNELASYSILVYFVRRLYFCIGMIIFYQSKNVQLFVFISSALIALIYTIWAKPYKETILNIFSIFGELCILLISSLCYYFDEIKIDEAVNSTTTSEQKIVGYI